MHNRRINVHFLCPIVRPRRASRQPAHAQVGQPRHRADPREPGDVAVPQPPTPRVGGAAQHHPEHGLCGGRPRRQAPRQRHRGGGRDRHGSRPGGEPLRVPHVHQDQPPAHRPGVLLAAAHDPTSNHGLPMVRWDPLSYLFLYPRVPSRKFRLTRGEGILRQFLLQDNELVRLLRAGVELRFARRRSLFKLYPGRVGGGACLRGVLGDFGPLGKETVRGQCPCGHRDIPTGLPRHAPR